MRFTAFLGALVALMAGPLTAHNGVEHVAGTVVMVDNNVLTMKTADGDIRVALGPQTKITEAGHAAKVANLKAGSAIVADIPEGTPEGNAMKVARSVRIGAAKAADHEHADNDHQHDGH